MSEFEWIHREKLEVDPMNIRKEADLDEQIIDSIKEKGIIQNLTVRPKKGVEDKYLITVGKRRFLAGCKAGIEEFPCKVRKELEGDNLEAMAISLVENRHRLNFSNGQWAEALRRLCEEIGLKPGKEETVEKIKEKTGMSRRQIKRYLKIADMPTWFVELTKEPEEQDLPRWIEAISKKPENRSDSEIKVLEEMCTVHIGSRESVEIPQIELTSITDGLLAEKLARDENFTKMAEETPLEAYRVASEASKKGRKQVKKVIHEEQIKTSEEKVDSESSERKKSIKQQFGQDTRKVTIELGELEYEAAKKAMEEHERIDDLNQMIIQVFIRYLKRKGYYS